jgi:hypothetical protein
MCRPIDSRTSHLMKGVPAMDIYSILTSKPHNHHYLNRYITFINQCQQKNICYKGSIENHHICPKADDMFPEYKNFKENPWNKATLTPRQHYIAHIMLWKIFPNIDSTSQALHYMSYGKWKDHVKHSVIYEKLKIQIANTKKNTFTVRDKRRKTFVSSMDNPQYLSGELVGITKGLVPVKDKDGNTFSVPVDDPRYLSGELLPSSKGLVPVKDKDGNTFSVPVDDPRYLSGELIYVLKGLVNVRDKNGNTFSVPVDDPRYLSGELVGITKGFTSVKDKNGKKFLVLNNDPRYLSGELVGVQNGMVSVKDKDGNTFSVSIDDPRYLSGELAGINKETKYITNGIKNRRIPKEEIIPEGWWRGITTRKKKE